jgi:hypothetical protein
MQAILLIILIPICFGSLSAQNIEPINTDRPDQSDGAYVLPKHLCQVEDGLLLAKETVLNNFMLRYGLTGSTEVRLLLNAGKSAGETGLLPVGLGVKQRLVTQKKRVPAITLSAYLNYEKLASELFKTDAVSTNILLAFQNNISDNFGIGYNVGTTDLFKDVNFTISLGYAPFNKLSTFLEYFAHFEPSTSANHNVDAGIVYLVTPTFQLDIALGSNLFSREAAFLTTGLSYRFSR